MAEAIDRALRYEGLPGDVVCVTLDRGLTFSAALHVWDGVLVSPSGVTTTAERLVERGGDAFIVRNGVATSASTLVTPARATFDTRWLVDAAVRAYFALPPGRRGEVGAFVHQRYRRMSGASQRGRDAVERLAAFARAASAGASDELSAIRNIWEMPGNRRHIFPA